MSETSSQKPDKSTRVLEVRNISKRFSRTIPAKQKQVIRQFTRALAGLPDNSTKDYKDEFWALKDVSFNLHKGETLGLLGLNGAGKSTLLTIIARQLLPEKGEIRSKGKISAMVNLSAGFEDSLTGNENIVLKGALAGYSKKEMEEKTDNIVNFAELGDFIKAPVATYSSGMRMRLAFAIAIHTEPDLLLIDEVLSVGDFQFKQKCLKKLNYLKKNTGIIFVSHSFQDIARFCDRVIVMRQGNLEFNGSSSEGLAFYKSLETEKNEKKSEENTNALIGPTNHDESIIDNLNSKWLDDNENQISTIEQGKALKLRISFTPLKDLPDFVIGIPIFDDAGQMLMAMGSELQPLPTIPQKDKPYSIDLKIQHIDLNEGIYVAAIVLISQNHMFSRTATSPINITSPHILTWGYFTPQFSWEIKQKQKESTK